MNINDLLAKANNSLQDMGNGEELSLTQMDALVNAFGVLNTAPNVSVSKPNTDELVAACQAIEEAWGDGEKGDWRGNLDHALRLARLALAEKTGSMPPLLSPTIIFEVDSNQVKVGQDIRVEYEDREEGRMLSVVLTHEGIIMDLYSGGDVIGTTSITYDEQIEEMLEGIS